MAHMVETMMYRGEAPWHKLGVKLDSPPTVEEGIKAAGLDWTVTLERLQLADGRPVNSYATVRSSDGSVLGTVGPRYRPLQNLEAFRFFNPFLSTAQAELHTAGSLDSGRRVWVLCRLNLDPIQIAAGDEVRKYLLLSHGHDGTLAVRVGFTPIRVVCANTLAMAHGDDASKLIRIRHTDSMRDNLDTIRDVMQLANQQFEATAEQYKRLASRTIHQADVRKYVRTVFQASDDPKNDSTRLRNILSGVVNLWETGRGNNLPSVRGTVWTAYNAVTEYLTHQRGGDRDSRMNSLWFGDSANLSARALELALAL